MTQDVGKPKKLFSLSEANGTLPLVSRVVRDIVRTYGEILKLESAEGDALPADRGERAEALADELREYVREIEKVGCELKDPRIGLVDFPALLEGRVVLLCWKLGEREIRHWHEIHAGFRGRQPVAGVFV